MDAAEEQSADELHAGEQLEIARQSLDDDCSAGTEQRQAHGLEKAMPL